MNLDNFKTRLVTERDELSSKVDKLSSFLDKYKTDPHAFKTTERHMQLLSAQLDAMNVYLYILDARLEELGG